MKKVAFIIISLTLHVGPSRADAQQAECLPRDPKAQNWPVKAIYMHGLFSASGPDTNGFRQLEAGNRKKIEELARRYQVRIAVPVAKTIGRHQMRNWNLTDLPQVEQQAREACGGAPLASPRVLIGFSNGGYRVRNFSFQGCDKIKAYSRILSLGAPNGTRTGICPDSKLVNRAPHALPSLAEFEELLADSLTSPSRAPREHRQSGDPSQQR